MKTVSFFILLFVPFIVPVSVMAQWGFQGAPGFSAGRADNVNLAIGSSGDLFVAYAPFDNTRKISVSKCPTGSTTWSLVGSPDFSAGYAVDLSMAISSANEPYVAYVDYANSQKASVMKFAGGSWTNVGPAGFTPSAVSGTSFAFSVFGEPYLAFSDGSAGGKASVMRFTGGSWQYIGSPGFSAGSASFVCMAIESVTNVPYVAFSDHQFSPPRATVMYFNGTSWVNKGAAGFSQNEARDLSLAFRDFGQLYLAYVDHSGAASTYLATVKKFNAATSAWVDAGPNPVYPGNVERTKLTFNGCGDPFVAFIDWSQANKATVVKLSTVNTWVTLGTAGVSPGGIAYPNLKFGLQNKLYMAFMDLANSLKATVMKFDGTLTLSSTVVPASCNPGNDGCLDLSVSGGVPSYSYVWSNLATTQDICNLTCGTYTVTVRDNFCNVVTSSFDFDDIMISATTCAAGTNCNGTIDVSVSCGTPPYTYLWNDGATTQDRTSMCINTPYCLIVMDALGHPKSCCWTLTAKKSACQSNFLQNMVVPNGQTSCYDAEETIYVAGNGSTFIIQNGGSATMIAGLKISYLPGTKVYPGGSLHGYITVNGQFCGNKNLIGGENTGQMADDSVLSWNNHGNEVFKVFPNPTQGEFFLEMNPAHIKQTARLEVYSLQGKMILSTGLTGAGLHPLSLAGYDAGVYLIRVVNGKYTGTGKIIRQ